MFHTARAHARTHTRTHTHAHTHGVDLTWETPHPPIVGDKDRIRLHTVEYESEESSGASCGNGVVAGIDEDTCLALPEWAIRSGPRGTIYFDPSQVRPCSHALLLLLLLLLLGWDCLGSACSHGAVCGWQRQPLPLSHAGSQGSGSALPLTLLLASAPPRSAGDRGDCDVWRPVPRPQ